MILRVIMSESKKIDKEVFGEKLKNKREEALAMLKNDKGNYFDEVQIGNIKYKIFENAPDELFTNETSELLPEDPSKPIPGVRHHYPAIIIESINFSSREIKRTDFYFWCFLGRVNFKDAEFAGKVRFDRATFCGEVNFSGTEFSQGVYFQHAEFTAFANFRGTSFHGDAIFERVSSGPDSKMDFMSARFEKKANFEKSQFSGDMIFDKATFYETTYFGNKTTYEKVLSFKKAIFKERCDLEVENFGDFVGFRGTEFRGSLFIDGAKLCENEDKLSFPSKLIVKEDGKENKKESKKNILAVKQMFNKIPSYDDEDHFYYWYKVYERESKYKDDDGNWKNKNIINHLIYWLWHIGFLDKITGYFTKPWRVFTAIPGTIFLFCLLYRLPWCSINGPNETTLWENLTFSLKSTDNIILFLEHLLKTLYFSAITFATIGYGDFHPVGFLTMFLAAVEGIIGVLLIATFLVTLTKKVLW